MSTLLDLPPTLQANWEELSEIVERLVKVYEPLRIYLFGSYAWGTPHQDSDYDICVVLEKSNEKPRQRSKTGIDALWDIMGKQSIDLLVYTIRDFDIAINHPSTMASLISRKGVMLYG
ncbi:MAG: nucleotidyltransferase domain-containing protein [Planctomycetaceae bacterium]|jgi:predicted nucleotidyltransferase|nr:nucleotidyltransferase domain-containing protein [Planctomycetaceae bacterium]